MDATDRISEEFGRLVALGRGGVAKCAAAEQVVYYVVATRCEIDIDGFSSVYEQHLNPSEITILVDGLKAIDENELAAEFGRGFGLLNQNGFYEHLNWNQVSSDVKAEIDVIGDRVGNRLWSLDDKLAMLLNENGDRRTSN